MTRKQPRVRHYGDIRFTLSPAGDLTDSDILENILGAMGIPIVVTNRHGQVAMWNDAFARRGNPKALVVGGQLDRVIPELSEPIKNRDWLAAARHVMEGGESVSEKRVPLRLGEDRPHLYDMAIHALHGSEDQILGAVLVLEDVSEDVRQENLRLRGARGRSLANLGAAVAHEIRNPLNSIGLNLQRLQEQLASHRGKATQASLQILELVDQEVRRLNRIVGDVLDYTRPPRLQPRLVDLGKLVGRSLAVLEEEARHLGVTTRDRLPRLSPVPGDPDRLIQVFQNLLRNAMQAAAATPEDSGHAPLVEVEGYETPEAVAIKICDTGPGLPPSEERARLFDIFYTTKEGGTGLGLAIANRIVEDHGGSIACDNRSDGGASFTVYLPRESFISEDVEPDDKRWQ